MKLKERLRAAMGVLRGMPFAVTFADGQSIRSADFSWLSQYGGYTQDGKIFINEKTALNLSAVWAANRVISGAVSILPAKVYEKTESDERVEVEPSIDQQPAALMAMKPNPRMTAITFWETIVTHMVMWGNGYAEIEFNSYGDPVALWPITPNIICPEIKENENLVYKVQTPEGKEEEIPARKMFHVPGLGWDGVKGYSVIGMARQSLEVTAGYEQGAQSFSKNSFRPAGAFIHPGTLQQAQKDTKKTELAKEHGGTVNWGKTLMLYGGMDWKPFGIPPTDAQFLETRVFQIAEVSRWFNVPQHMLRELTRATFSNIEHQGQEFVTYSLMYWLTKIAQEWNAKLLANRPGQYYEHNTDALLRGDTQARYEAYAKGRQWGFLSANDIRRRENMPKIEGGDEYLTPVNMRPSDSPYVPPTTNSNTGGAQ